MMEKHPADAVNMARRFYETYPERVRAIRQRLGRPLTLTEKILFAHCDVEGCTSAAGTPRALPSRRAGAAEDREGGIPERGISPVFLRPDRVAMQDATAQMALLQFMTASRDRVAVPTTIHCDHLVRAKVGALKDLEVAEHTNHEVYEFLASVAAKYGIGFWKPGSGIIHQVILEHYAFPGGLMIGTDSHTPNAGGLGMIAIGVGGADAVDVLVDMPWEVGWPKIIGVRLSGKLTGWTSGKDVILKLAGMLTAAGGTGKIIEYFGPGVGSLSCTAKATVTNMGAELGATTSLFPFDSRMAEYLRATGRTEIAHRAEAIAPHLVADPEVAAEPERYYDELIEIDLTALEPHVVGPHTPDLARPVSQMPSDVRTHGYPVQLKTTLIGSCTNSSYEDLGRAAHVARQANAHGLRAKVPFLVTPGSEQVRATIERDGLLGDLEAMGATVLANACGPCIGQWDRPDINQGESNSILTSYNRNFPRRNDGNPATCAFIASPEVVTAYALTGTLDIDPIYGGIPLADGTRLQLAPPEVPELPERGFIKGGAGYAPPADDPASVTVEIAPNSERLSPLEPFAPVDKQAGYRELPVLLKAQNKCTTDHISPAGPWLRYRGYLDRISDNMFSGADNAFTAEPGTGYNVFTGATGQPLHQIARDYKAQDQGWVVVGDSNYGEGSSREHAAMSPRHLGCRVVLVRSFARIHQTNLKKQGILPLVFADPADFDHIQHGDRMSFRDLDQLAPGKPVSIEIRHADGSRELITATHTLSEDQIAWFMAGSALNRLRHHTNVKQDGV